MRARIPIFLVSIAFSLTLSGCFLWQPSPPRFRPETAVDLFKDTQMAEGADVVWLREAELRAGPKPLSATAPEYKLAVGDVLEVIYQTQYEKDPQEYRIEIEDELLIEVLYNPDLTQRVTVRPDGRITLAMVGEEFVLGKTSAEVAAELRLLYGRYLRQPEVHVAIGRFNGRINDLLKAIGSTAGGQSKTFTVRPDGRITLPLIGEVNAAGYNIPEVREAVQKRYAEAIRNLQANVSLAQASTPQVYVDGQVKTPGAYPIRNRIHAAQAITLAGGALLDGDLRRVVLMKRAGTEEPQSCQINLAQILKEGRLEDDIVVEPDDLVYVPRTTPPTIYVAGEVNLPGAYPHEPEMDIFDAMALAKGTLDTANLHSIVVIRRTNVDRPVAFRVDLTRALGQGDLRYNLKLQPDDAIFFPKTYVARMDVWIQQWLTDGLYSAFPSNSTADFVLDAHDVYDLYVHKAGTAGSVRSR